MKKRLEGFAGIVLLLSPLLLKVGFTIFLFHELGFWKGLLVKFIVIPAAVALLAIINFCFGD